MNVTGAKYIACPTNFIDTAAGTFLYKMRSRRYQSRFFYNGKTIVYGEGIPNFRHQFVSDGNVASASANNSYVLGKEHRIAMTRTIDFGVGTCVHNIYVDGAQSGAVNVPRNWVAGTAEVRLMRDALADAFYLLYFDVVLSLADQNTLFNELDSIVYESHDWTANGEYAPGQASWLARFGALARNVTLTPGRSVSDINGLYVASGSFKMSAAKHADGIMAKELVCVTNGDLWLPDYYPNRGTDWYYYKYTNATGTWEWANAASRIVSLLAGDKLVWARQDGKYSLYKA